MAVEEEPSDDDYDETDTPEDHELFGIFRGVPFFQRGAVVSSLPAQIAIFRAPDPAQLRLEGRGGPCHPRHRRPRGRPHAGVGRRGDAVLSGSRAVVRGARLGVLLLCAWLASSGGEAATSAEVARSEAEANARTPAGRSYEGVAIAKAETWLRPAIQRCARQVAKEEIVSFDGLIRVSAQGKAEEVLFGPETALARCVAPDFRDALYPKPPKPDWWLKIEIRPR